MTKRRYTRTRRKPKPAGPTPHVIAIGADCPKRGGPKPLGRSDCPDCQFYRGISHNLYSLTWTTGVYLCAHALAGHKQAEWIQEKLRAKEPLPQEQLFTGEVFVEIVKE